MPQRLLSAPGLTRSLLIAFIFFMSAAVSAEPPPGYYDPVDPSNPQLLRSTLHDVIDDHDRFPYTSSGTTDTWDILEMADEDPDDPGLILDLYKNASYPKAGEGNTSYDREHAWIEMRLRALRACRVRIPGAGLDLSYSRGDEIRTEISCKYTRASLEARLAGTGLGLTRWFTDAEELFALAVLRPEGAIAPSGTSRG